MIEKLNYNDIKIGMRVMNDTKEVGIIIECDDIHNVLVEFTTGSSGFYCLELNCDNENLYQYELEIK